MIKDIIYCVMSGIAIALILLLARVREDVVEIAAFSKYRELLKASAVSEDPAAIYRVTGISNDWTAVPQFLFGERHMFDVGTSLTLAPVVLLFLVAVVSLLRRSRRRRI
jgi:hypothetical protein